MIRYYDFWWGVACLGDDGLTIRNDSDHALWVELSAQKVLVLRVLAQPQVITDASFWITDIAADATISWTRILWPDELRQYPICEAVA